MPDLRTMRIASASLVCWLGASGVWRERPAVIRDEEAARLADILPEASQPIDWHSDESTRAHAVVNMLTNERIAALFFEKDVAQRPRARRRSWRAWLAWRPRRGARSRSSQAVVKISPLVQEIGAVGEAHGAEPPPAAAVAGRAGLHEHTFFRALPAQKFGQDHYRYSLKRAFFRGWRLVSRHVADTSRLVVVREGSCPYRQSEDRLDFLESDASSAESDSESDRVGFLESGASSAESDSESDLDINETDPSPTRIDAGSRCSTVALKRTCGSSWGAKWNLAQLDSLSDSFSVGDVSLGDVSLE